MLISIKYDPHLTSLFPELCTHCIYIDGLDKDANFDNIINDNIEYALKNLAQIGKESSFHSISLWREAYRKVGVDPTKFRIAPESLLRRLRTKGEIPSHLHPLVLLCNSFSVKLALPIAVLDAECINGNLTIKFSNGIETYTSFSGEKTKLLAGEVSFIDEKNIAHARKWSHKQSLDSVITNKTKSAIVFIESLLPFNGNYIYQSSIDEIISAISLAWPNSKIHKTFKNKGELNSEIINLKDFKI
ncbi:hypothetical protein COO59_16345 [Mixta theicola]|uniref:B3/B4 tRNA-binding domain-containing protein n=1 Tax=Mixta theicola TaxID=1458355 RepID=A0A2K1Q6K8_9GAMM|nr:phenylalanine--tRNA ligase beta subunit-related protein [Mixta theicola]PNS10683.1 hypothetical protein COO59_16345 [Mixta theicola]GLR10929.1 hypothetical protein GCM10007905_36490 [Mixta theicola]